MRIADCFLKCIPVLVLLCTTFAGPPNAFSDEPPLWEQVQIQIKAHLAAPTGLSGLVCRGDPICGSQIIPTFYAQHEYKPIWIDAYGLNAEAFALLQAIGQADREGLNPMDYHQQAIEAILSSLLAPNTAQMDNWTDLELLMTDALLLLSSHLAKGRVNPETLHTDWLLADRSVDLMAVLDSVAGKRDVAQILDRLRPTHLSYRLLQTAREHLYRQVAQGGWPRVPVGATLRPGDKDPRSLDLRQRLYISGDLTSDELPEDVTLYDDPLVAAVQHFQRRHGLYPDGLVGERTLRALNVPAAQRLRQIELNLERWRWLPRDLGARYLVVNTADFSLKAVEEGRTVLSMRVVVGRPARRTPVFSALLTYMVFNPYWTIPRTIAVEDILPRLAKDVDFLMRQGIKVFDGWQADGQAIDPHLVNWSAYSADNFPFRLRQEPGPTNALGRIKFMFPNKFDVYLHDTPNRSLFHRVQRDFSSGCIRVEDAVTLAAFLLDDERQWSAQKIRQALETGAREIHFIPHPLNVHLLYMTAWVDAYGVLQFRDDIYDRDKDLDRALKQRHPAGASQLTVSMDHS